jgi:hypothetical protein
MGYDVLIGDWDGDGLKTQGVFAKGEWRLGEGVDHSAFMFGLPGDLPLVGNWDGDGSDSPAVFDGVSIRFLQPGVSVALDPDVVRRNDEPPWLHISSQGWSYLTMDPETGVVETRIMSELPSSPEL